MPDLTGLSGSLSVLSLPGLVQLLAAEQRTGRLDVLGAEAPLGSIWLESGRVVHAAEEGAVEEGAVEGAIAEDGAEDADVEAAEEAAVHVLDTEAGAFRFEPGAQPPIRSLDVAASHLLLEAARRRDHAERESWPEMPEVTPATIPALVAEPPGGASPRFDTLQWRLLASVDGRRTVRSIAEAAGVPLQAAAEVVDDLMRSGVLTAAADSGPGSDAGTPG